MKLRPIENWRSASLIAACGAFLAALVVPRMGQAEEPTADAAQTLRSASQYIKIVKDPPDGDDVCSLETSITSFRGQLPDGDELRVDLVAAVHLADKTYYDQLNQRFAGYERVLYELVAPEGTPIPRGGRGSSHPLGATQRGLSGALDLTFQLEQVDYTGQQFIHADLSPDEFAQSMRQRDETVMKIMFRMMGHAMATQTKSRPGASDAKLVAALLAKNRPLEMKRVMAEQMADIDQAIGVLDGPAGSTLIGVRNQRVIDVLAQEVKHGTRHAAIFYGAAHMPDMSARLLKSFPLTLHETIWLMGWDMRPAAERHGQPAAD